MLKLAMVQMLVEGGQLERNLARAAAGIAEAALHGCPIALLPECLDLGWTHPSAGELAAAVPGPTSDRLAQAAAQAGLYVVAGLTERAGERVYNAAVLIDPRGRIVLKHRKINLLDIEQTSYSIGDRLQVAETSLGTVGVNICADNFPDSLALGHALARMGAEVILSPSAWAVPADYDPAAEPYGKLWKDAYADLAPLYDMPIAGCSNVGRITGGPWAGRKCIGCSLAVDARGNVLAKGRYGDDAEELIVVDLPLAPRRVKGTDIGPMLRGRGYRGP
jgi:predicted amidohydrolase